MDEQHPTPSAAAKRALQGFMPLIGVRTPGGCDDCNAYQETEQVADGVILVNVRHDDTCPFLNSRQ